MIIFLKKFSTYFSASLTFLVGIKAAFSLSISPQVCLLISPLLIFCCAAIVWIESAQSDVSWKVNSNENDGPISLSISRAFDTVKIHPRDDESIAFQANKIIKKYLDKGCISYKDYKKWRDKNSNIFTAITDTKGELIGFFDIFPLTEYAAKKIVNGSLKENELSEKDILPLNMNKSAKTIYIASIMATPEQTLFSPIVAKEVIILKFVEFLMQEFPPEEDRSIFAYAHTAYGERLLKNSGFTNILLSKDNKMRDPLYHLSPEEIS